MITFVRVKFDLMYSKKIWIQLLSKAVFGHLTIVAQYERHAITNEKYQTLDGLGENHYILL